MAVIVGDPIRHVFPPSGSAPWTLEDAYATWSATQMRMHFPYNPIYNHYWIQWCSVADFSGEVHTSYDADLTGASEIGDWVTKDLVGFEPESVWYFRAIAADEASGGGSQ